MKTAKTCAECKHLHISLGADPVMYNGGYPGEIECEMGHWCIDCDEKPSVMAAFRVYVKKAKHCEDYEHYEKGKS